MAAEVSDRVRRLARERGVGESEIIREAVESGVETLWRDLVVEQYLEDELSRDAAIDELGRDVVHEVDRARSAVEADVEWGLGGSDSK